MLAILILSAQFYFSGGDEVALAKWIREHTKQPVAILSTEPKVVPEFKIEVDAVNDQFWKELRSLTDLRREKAEYVSLNYGWLSTAQVKPLLARVQHTYNGQLDRTSIQLDERGILTANGYVSVETLTNARFTKSVTTHWIYLKCLVALSAESASEKQVLNSIASSCGATLEETDSHYEFAFDAESFRRLAIPRLSKLAEESRDAFERLSIELQVEALRNATADQINAAYLTPNSEVWLDAFPGSPLVELAWKRLSAWTEVEPGHPYRDRELSVRQRAIESIDAAAPMKIRLAPAGSGTKFRSKNPNESIVI